MTEIWYWIRFLVLAIFNAEKFYVRYSLSERSIIMPYRMARDYAAIFNGEVRLRKDDEPRYSWKETRQNG